MDRGAGADVLENAGAPAGEEFLRDLSQSHPYTRQNRVFFRLHPVPGPLFLRRLRGRLRRSPPQPWLILPLNFFSLSQVRHNAEIFAA